MERMKMVAATDEWSPEEIKDELQGAEPELFRYLSLLPRSLWGRHFKALQALANEHASEPKETVGELRINYIRGILEAREGAIVEFDTHDPKLKEGVFDSKERLEKLGKSLRELLITNGNLLGSGQTARVKSMQLEGMQEPIAVKYLLTPTDKTLSAAGEHEMLYEVETLIDIEDSEDRLGTFERIGVPHPYFHYKRGEMQCYAMSEISGVTIEEILNDDGAYHPRRDSALEALRMRYASEEDKKSLTKEIDTFMRAVHEVCLHGDIKPKNVMVDVNGKFYLIDFGQSVHMNTMSDKTRGQFENLQDEERGQMRICIEEALRRSSR